MLNKTCVLAALALASMAAFAHDDPSEKLGTVSFQNSCKKEVQAELNRAVAMLHSFWFPVGDKTFREVLAKDPSCAVAGWGIAAIQIGNTFANNPPPAAAQRARDAINQARKIGAKTERERLYIEAINEYWERFADRTPAARMKSLSDAFEVLAKRFPKDDEAQIFSALYLTATQDATEQTFAAALKAAAILGKQFPKHPNHPGVAHYLIHSYDYPPIAQKGLKAARLYASIAPSAPHALHMPSHIFTRVGAWQDSIGTNVRSSDVARKEKEPGSIVHAMDYMVYAQMQLAKDADARAAVDEVRRMTGLAPIGAVAYATASMPARYAVERGAWKDAALLQPAGGKVAYTEAITHFARALGAARSGDPAGADKDVAQLARLVGALKAAKDEYWATEVEVQRLGAAAWTAYAKGSRPEALALMRAAAILEDGSEKHAVTPGRLLPARELLGEMLLESGRHKEALAEFELSQQRDPNRFRGLFGAGRAAEQAGERAKAKTYYRKLVANAGSGASRPELERARAYLATR